MYAKILTIKLNITVKMSLLKFISLTANEIVKRRYVSWALD